MALPGVTSERLRLSISPRKNVIVLFKNLNTGVRDYKYTWKGKRSKRFQESQKHSYRTRVTCSGCGKIIIRL